MLIQHTAVLVQRHPHAFSNTWLLNPMDPNNSVSVHLSIYSSPSLYAAHPASTQLTQPLRSSPSFYAAHPASTQLTQLLRSSPSLYAAHPAFIQTSMALPLFYSQLTQAQLTLAHPLFLLPLYLSAHSSHVVYV